MNLVKLAQRGIGHLVPLFVVVFLAIGFSAYTVIGHADSNAYMVFGVNGSLRASTQSGPSFTIGQAGGIFSTDGMLPVTNALKGSAADYLNQTYLYQGKTPTPVMSLNSYNYSTKAYTELNIMPLPSGSSYADLNWSEATQELMWIEATSKGDNIQTANSKGYNITTVFRGTAGVPQWSPNGKLILFDGASSPEVINVNGSGLRSLPKNVCNDTLPGSWMPDNQTIVCVNSQGSGLLSYNLSSGKTKILIAPGAKGLPAGEDIYAVSVSPNGQQVAYTIYPYYTKLTAVDVAVYTFSSNQATIVYANNTSNLKNTLDALSWSPGSTKLAFGTTKGLYVVNPNGSSLKTLYNHYVFGIEWAVQ